MESDPITEKYRRQIESQLNVNPDDLRTEIHSKNYEEFRKELLPAQVGGYEKLCNTCEKIVQFKPGEKARNKLLSQIEDSHLQVTPEGVYTASYLIPFALLFFSMIGFVLLPLLLGADMSLFFLAVSMIMSLVIIIPLQKYPGFLATSWKLKASNQMVLAIFYIVTYLRQSSNLERAIEFAADHLEPPLSLDMKKIIWNVETEKYDTISESLDEYLKGWKKTSDEFIDSMHLLESSLLEGNEARRMTLLDKALDVMLEGTFEKMLHYAQSLKNPITTLHMLGVILPILGLVILPLAISFLEGISWIHLAVFYNCILPVVVYFLGKSILSARPSGYGDSDASEYMKGLQKYKGLYMKVFGVEFTFSPVMVACIVGGVLMFIGLLPLAMHLFGAADTCWAFDNPGLICSDQDRIDIECKQTYCVLGYKDVLDDNGNVSQLGPFGLIASLLSLFIPLSFGVGLGIYYRLISGRVIKVREETKKMEKEFSTALFQLGNRLGDGLPAEVAIPKVAQIMEGTVSGSFFAQISNNVSRLGLGLVPAIFDKKVGAVNYFPSKIISSSMKVLVESMKKGPQIAAQAVNNVARYIKEIHRVNERLKDLLADIISSMKQQIGFLAPVISAVVVGITSMITFILGELQSQAEGVAGGLDSGEVGNLLDFGLGIPTYFFQAVVGTYVVEIVFILTIMANTIENGEDKLAENFNLGKNLVRSTIMYAGITFIVLLLFQIIAGEIIGGSLG